MMKQPVNPQNTKMDGLTNWYKLYYYDPKGEKFVHARAMGWNCANGVLFPGRDLSQHAYGPTGNIRGIANEILCSTIFTGWLSNSPYKCVLGPSDLEHFGFDILARNQVGEENVLAISVKMKRHLKGVKSTRPLPLVHFRTPGDLTGVDTLLDLQREGYTGSPEEFISDRRFYQHGPFVELIGRENAGNLDLPKWECFPQARQVLIALQSPQYI